MTEGLEKIPFKVDISRVIEVLATQIYQTPLALLRENAQNSFDAILMREQLGRNFDPLIEIVVSAEEIQVSDNGIGMTREDLRNHYWRAGSSSKNTPEARAAGVVGTFGIGAMANFGIAEELIVVTESAVTGERSRCEAKRSTLSATEDCISFISETSTGKPGTNVIARIQPGKDISVEKARSYIKDFVALLGIQVTFNGECISRRPITDMVHSVAEAWSVQATEETIGPIIKADVDLRGANTGDFTISLTNILLRGERVPGRLLLHQGLGILHTYRNGFGLATTSVRSVYQFGGIVDFLFLNPTAGREALTTDSMQILQAIISEIENFTSMQLAKRPESDSSTPFISWVLENSRFELCDNLKIRCEPDNSITLGQVRERSNKQQINKYSGNEMRVIQSHASIDSPLLVLARSNPRRQCEIKYLSLFCKTQEISDNPKILKSFPASSWTTAQSGLAFRIESILAADYFIDTSILFGQISHDLPIFVDSAKKPVEIYLDPNGSTTSITIDLYEKNYLAFSGMTKDFVRNIVFPRISELVPSSTRSGAEAFLKAIQKPREIFEYETGDLESLSSIWADYAEGKLTIEEAAERSKRIATRSIQVIESSATVSVREVVPDVIDNEETIQKSAGSEDAVEDQAAPPIERREVENVAKLIIIPPDEPALRGFRCFIAISDRIREDKGEFFLQPHRTSIVWGGQKALFVFEHHSNRFGLYYEVQSSDLLAYPSGGKSYPTCTIIIKNRTFIPIPPEIQAGFIPIGTERKRLEVRADILYTDEDSSKGIPVTH